MDALTSVTPILPGSLTGDLESFRDIQERDTWQKLEGVFLSLLLKEMRSAGLEDGLFPGDASDTFGSMFDSFLGDELAEAGGIGLQRLFQSIPVSSDSSESGAVTDARDQAVEAYRHAEQY